MPTVPLPLDARGRTGGTSVLRGWPLVGWSALGIGTMATVLLGAAGAGEPGLRLVIRATARTSVAFFTLAFVASALHRRWPAPATRWLLDNRRYLGVSFGVSHLVHLLAILQLTGWSVRGFFAAAGLVTGVLGGLGYGVLAAMVATSFDCSAAWLGPGRWRRLHGFGVWYLWGIFLVTFAPRAGASPGVYLPVTVGLLTAAALRLAARRGGRSAA